MYDKNVSPVGWYVCSYLLRFIELDDPGREDVEAKFLSWENTILISAKSIAEAYDKTVSIAMDATKPYKGGSEGVDVQWVFEGITEVLPIYEEIEDGAEIMWRERTPRKLKNLRGLVRQKNGIVAKSAVPAVTSAQKAELDNRLADHLLNPHDVISWSDVKAKALANTGR